MNQKLQTSLMIDNFFYCFFFILFILVFNIPICAFLVSHMSPFLCITKCVAGRKGVMDVENSMDDDHFQQSMGNGDGMNVEGGSMEIITRVELELAFASEKLLNLEMLVMEIARKATDFEPPTLEDESVSSETAESAFELDILYGFLDAEVGELDDMISTLETDIQNVEHMVCQDESGGKIKARLDAAMVSLKQMKELVSDIRKESAKFEKAIEFPHDKEGNAQLPWVLYASISTLF